MVKYNGKAKGTVAHTDNSEYKFITVNAILSGQDEYSGGGTEFSAVLLDVVEEDLQVLEVGGRCFLCKVRRQMGVRKTLML